MEAKRIETSQQRLQEKINEAKEYLERDSYESSELKRLKNHLEKKKCQFEKDIETYEKTENRDDEKLELYKNLEVEAEDIFDDIEHYINVSLQKEQKRELERQAEEKKHEREAEERRLEREAEDRERERRYQLEMEKVKSNERITIQQLHVEETKVEAERKIATVQEHSKLTVKLPKIELKKFHGDILKWTEFWDAFESTVHKNKGLSNVDKFNYLRSQLHGQASEVLSGLELTNDSYEVAIELLKERYGRKQFMIDAHYAKLANMSPPTYKATSLRTFYDTTEKHLRCLRTLGEDDNQMQVLSLMKSKLPRSLIVKLEEQKPDDEEWTVKKFRKLLNKHINCQEAGDLQMKLHNTRDENAIRPQSGNRPSPGGTNNFSTSEGLLSNEGTKRTKYGRKCIFCKGEHWSDECQQYTDIPSRKKQLKNRCLRCLKEDHKIKDCKVTGKLCVHCGEKDRHHRTLCPKKFSQTEPSTTTTVAAEADTETGLVAAGETVIMKTAMVTVNGNKTNTKTRAFFDSGSSRTYITKELMNTLKLKSSDNQNFYVNTFGNSKQNKKTLPTVNLVMKMKFGPDLKMKATVIEQITGPLQRAPLRLKDHGQLTSQFQLADTIPNQLETYNLGLLIGNDYYDKIVLGERKQVQDNLYLLKSTVGWILSGRTSREDQPQDESAMFVMSTTARAAPHVLHMDDKESMTFEPDLEDLWKLESIGIKPDDPREKDDIAMEMFKNSVIKRDNRYSISWPWRNDDQINLPENYELSLGRLKSLMKHLQKDPELLQRYDETIKSQIEKAVIERVDPSEVNNENKKHYIPHHGVVKPDNRTTKLRIVYDASAKTKKGNKSLNESLHRGPVILEDLCGLLLRFRTNKIGIIADIEKAFLQIGIQEADRDVTRFLWLKDMTKPVSPENLEVFRFARLPFGIICSPFLLGATIQHHIENTNVPAAEKIKDNIYVDNIITGAENEKEAIELYKGAKTLFKDASMNLREWLTSSSEVNDQFEPEDRIDTKVTKVLGLKWNSQSDELSINTTKIESMEPAATKRQVLSTNASIYDPLGMMSPATINMKILLQELWEKGVEWDELLNSDIQRHWKDLTHDLNELSQIQIPRFIGNEQALAFCDASKKAYATAIYLRTVIDNQVNVNLIFSKAKVAPKEKKTKKSKSDKPAKTKKKKEKEEMSVPRLELMATLIGTRVLKFIANELGLQNKMTLWADSKCVLDWLKQKQNDDVFVRNRVDEIIKSEDIQFRYVDTDNNPADIPTRGTSATELKTKTVWWNGPDWLKKDPDEWPTWNYTPFSKDDLDDRGDSDIIFEMSATQPEVQSVKSPFGIDETRYSSYNKLLRVTAYANRFIINAKDKARTNNHEESELTAEELNQAEIRWIKYLQQKHYFVNKQLNDKQKQSQLNPSIHDDGIIRLHGRFTNSNLPDETRLPILLPREEHFTKLLIKKTHADAGHGSTAHTLGQLRQKFWVPQGRTAVKTAIRKCLICIRWQGGPYRVKPIAPLPKSRVTASPPFTNTGIDYFGPLYIKNEGVQKKVWICLFTCTAVRAVHLEVVEDMTAEQFLEALRRFVSRRGKPDEIISDNALQFKAAKNTIDIAWGDIVNDPQVQSYLSEKRIKWKFIVELSPWFGGFYERLVGTTKMALKKSIGKLHLSLTQLQTVIYRD